MYKPTETDEVLLDTDEYMLVVKGYEILYGDLCIYYYFQNKTDVDIYYTTKSAKINGEYRALITGESFVFAGGYGEHDNFSWFSDDYTDVELDTIEFDIVVYAEEFEYDPVIDDRKELYRQTVTISEIFKE